MAAFCPRGAKRLLCLPGGTLPGCPVPDGQQPDVSALPRHRSCQVAGHVDACPQAPLLVWGAPRVPRLAGWVFQSRTRGRAEICVFFISESGKLLGGFQWKVKLEFHTKEKQGGLHKHEGLWH